MAREVVELGGIMYALSTPQRSVSWRDSLRDESGRSSSKFKYDVDSSPGAGLRASQLETAARLSSPFLQRLATVAVDASQPEQPGENILSFYFLDTVVVESVRRNALGQQNTSHSALLLLFRSTFLMFGTEMVILKYILA